MPGKTLRSKKVKTGNRLDTHILMIEKLVRSVESFGDHVQNTY